MIKSYVPNAVTLFKDQSKPNVKQSWFGIPGAIYFYNKGQPYYEFTNFADGYPFNLDGDFWQTSEQYYQAQKFIKYPGLYKAIRDLHSDKSGSAVKKAFDLARANKKFIDPSWNTKSLNVMRKALNAKFNQNPNLLSTLRKTGNAVLVEDSPVDEFFGAGKYGTGENYLGRLLMEIR